MGRASVVKNDYSNCTFSRLTLKVYALTRTISLSYMLFHFPHAISIEQRLNDKFEFLNGQFIHVVQT